MNQSTATTRWGICCASPCCASPTWPDPEADQGHQHFSYALYPHSGDWKQALTVRHGYDFDYHLKAMQVDIPLRRAAAAPFLKAEPENVVLTAMKRAEDGKGLVMRFYESAGKGGNVTLTAASRDRLGHRGQPDGEAGRLAAQCFRGDR